jgi:hypothetical protein
VSHLLIEGCRACRPVVADLVPERVVRIHEKLVVQMDSGAPLRANLQDVKLELL